MKDAVPYAHCIDKKGHVRTLASVCALSQIQSNMNSYLNDEIINMFSDWLYAMFPGGFVYVPPVISKYSSLAAQIFPKVLNGGIPEVTQADRKAANQYMNNTKEALRGWLLGKGDTGMTKPFIFFPINFNNNHWVLAVAVNPFGRNVMAPQRKGLFYLDPLHQQAQI